MKRFFDLTFCIFLILILMMPMVFIGIFIRLSSKGPAIYWSNRVGKNSLLFRMPKFRTMIVNTPAIATHLMHNSEDYLTPVGRVLRKFSLDELPQLFSILKGEMSFVGPRPALYNQSDLIALRKSNGIDKLLPGVTGWAQINGRDSNSIKEKVELEIEYLNKKSFFFDLLILGSTIFKIIRNNDISH